MVTSKVEYLVGTALVTRLFLDRTGLRHCDELIAESGRNLTVMDNAQVNRQLFGSSGVLFT